jgi:hypothetical protein
LVVDLYYHFVLKFYKFKLLKYTLENFSSLISNGVLDYIEKGDNTHEG